MKRFILSIFAVTFPWVVMLVEDNPFAAFVTLILQASIIGWIPASIWAWQEINKGTASKKKAKKQGSGAAAETTQEKSKAEPKKETIKTKSGDK
jgi:uncharacterized membrane protein YqaE (UPF0057 family)